MPSPAEAVSKPSAPRSVTASPTAGGARVSWQKPETKGGCRIKRYKVAVKRGSMTVKRKSLGPGARSTSFSGLTPRTAHTVVVRAKNCRKLGHARTRTFVPRLAGVAPMGDTAKGTYWLPGGLGQTGIHYEIWKFDPVSHSVMAIKRDVYQHYGNIIGWAFSYGTSYVYVPTGRNSLFLKQDQTTTIGPSTHSFVIQSYDATLDIVTFSYDGHQLQMGGCRNPGVQANIPWLCL